MIGGAAQMKGLYLQEGRGLQAFWGRQAGHTSQARQGGGLAAGFWSPFDKSLSPVSAPGPV
jgi:hypothetical protein